MYGNATKKKPDFLIALEVFIKCFSYTFNLSKLLQSKRQNVCNALSDVAWIKSTYKVFQEDADNSFKTIMENVLKLASIVNV